MDLSLDGRAAAVAAASRGIGRAVADALAREGARVAICARGEEALQKAAAEIEERYKAPVFAFRADVSVPAGARAFIRKAVREFGTVDILVNNAGGPPAGHFEDFDEEDWMSAIRLNLISTVIMTGEVLPHMKKRRWGRIINITSVTIKQPVDGLILSTAARLGVAGMAKSLSVELAPYGITVNNVCPGYTLTDRVRSLAEKQAKERGTEAKDIIKSWVEKIPAGRMASPGEVADLVVFLASERASYITGTSIQIDGGYYRGF